jgi:hypothetical protein
MVAPRRQLFGTDTRVKAELLLDLREKRMFLIVSGIEPRQDPALSLGVSKSDDDPSMEG